MRNYLIVSAALLIPCVAFAGADRRVAGAPDSAVILATRGAGLITDQLAYAGVDLSGSTGLIGGSVLGHVPAGMQTNAFIVVGPAGSQIIEPGLIRTEPRNR
jgi:hypothetical protein